MGVVSEKSLLVGLFGGSSTTKGGQHYLSVISEGPKLHKVRCQSAPLVPSDVVFGSPVTVELSMAETKFQDFNGSFTEVASAKIQLKKAA